MRATDPAAIGCREECLDRDVRAVGRRVGADRHRAPATEPREERPLRVDHAPQRGVLDRVQRGERRVVARTALDRDRTLRDLGEHHGGRQTLSDPVAEVETIEGRGRDDDRIEGRRLPEPGVHVAPQLGEPEIGAQPGELRSSAHRAGRHDGPGGECIERRADEGVAWVPALGHCREDETVEGRRREVLRRVDRDVGATVEHGLLDLLHEDPGPADLVDRGVRTAVPRGLDDDELGLGPADRREQRDDPLRLPACEGAATGRDPQPAHQDPTRGGRSGSDPGEDPGAARASSSGRANRAAIASP